MSYRIDSYICITDIYSCIALYTCYCGTLLIWVNAGIGLILAIQTLYFLFFYFFIHLFLVYYIIRMSTQALLLYDPLLFLLIYSNHIRLHKTLSYRSVSLCFFTLLILKFIYIYVHFYVFIYYYYYHALGALNISFY